MASGSQENISGFIIQGFSETPELQIYLFVLFLAIYLRILLGNLIIFFAISYNPHLHTPILLTQQSNISFLGCMTQMYIFASLATSEYILLTAMAFDRYVAICDPLRYIVKISMNHCAWFITAAFTVGFVNLVSPIKLQFDQ
ncbi:hypothetical protein XELAEV_18034393mg, partial [Xenopus laevis]